MEIGNETGCPRHDHIWIAGASAGVVVYETAALVRVKVHLSAGVSKPWQDPFSTTKLYLYCELRRESSKSRALAMDPGHSGLFVDHTLFWPPKKASSVHPSMLPSFFSPQCQQSGSWQKPGQSVVKELTWEQSDGVNSRPWWQSAV